MRYIHHSDHEIERPLYGKLINNITGHVNGALGMWFACYSDDCCIENQYGKGFGNLMYELKIPDHSSETHAYEMTVEELRSLSETHTKEGFMNLRNKLIDDGFVYVKIVEHDLSVDMIVLMDFSEQGILSFEKVEK